MALPLLEAPFPYTEGASGWRLLYCLAYGSTARTNMYVCLLPVLRGDS